MPRRQLPLIQSVFVKKLRPQLKELYSSAVIFNFALAAVNIFEPIFLYGIFAHLYHPREALAAVLWFYVLVYVLYFFIVPLGAKLALQIGYERTMSLGSLLTIGFYITLFAASTQPLLIAVAAVVYAVSKTLYWPAYHADFARYSVDGQQGREIGNLMLLLSVAQIFGPLVGGVLIKFYGFSILFFVASLIALLSTVPMLVTGERFKASYFSYFDSYRRLLSPDNRRRVIAYFGFGEELLAMVVWPIYIFIVIKDFAGVGLLVALSVLATTLTLLYVGRAADMTRGAILRYGTALYIISWLLRTLTRGVLGVFAVDLFGRVAKEAISIPLTALTYERAQDTSVMKTVLLFEMSLVAGKILAAVLALGILAMTDAGWWQIFLLGGAFTALYGYFLPRIQR
ncbi:MAG: MFS transporter [Candidatus Buchananbacteria bacterium]|nr:MFS transporter [Candidatus Buchananbacteria bacterium]